MDFSELPPGAGMRDPDDIPGETHDDRCCTEGSLEPEPFCPGIEALSAPFGIPPDEGPLFEQGRPAVLRGMEPPFEILDIKTEEGAARFLELTGLSAEAEKDYPG